MNLVFILLFFILDLGKECDVTSYVTVTQSYDIEKNVEDFGTNNII